MALELMIMQDDEARKEFDNDPGHDRLKVCLLRKSRSLILIGR
jgi:hypothetical protein